jgi:hypothetical protein
VKQHLGPQGKKPGRPGKQIERVADVCGRLAGHGWRNLLLAHGLDIGVGGPDKLARELARDLPQVRRDLKGFEDFAREGRQGIQPGYPARSLLYHALASPNVLTGADGRRLGDFPTAAEIEVIEDYVFGAEAPAVQELLQRTRELGAQSERLSVVVFACEYRPASQTCHKIHADMVYSRTGVARVGTAPAR